MLKNHGIWVYHSLGHHIISQGSSRADFRGSGSFSTPSFTKNTSPTHSGFFKDVLGYDPPPANPLCKIALWKRSFAKDEKEDVKNEKNKNVFSSINTFFGFCITSLWAAAKIATSPIQAGACSCNST
jgi:hypothetical protein